MKIDFSKLSEFFLNKKEKKSFIYFLLDKDKIVYIGISSKMEQRMRTHKSTTDFFTGKKKIFTKIFYLEINNFDDFEIKLLEQCLIYEIKPKYNAKRIHFKILNRIGEKSRKELINKYFPQ